MNTLLLLHSLVRWLILLTGIWAFIRAWQGVSSKSPYSSADTKAGLFFMIFLDIQFLLGLILFFISPLVKTALGDMGAAMKVTPLRFFTIEHTTMAILAIALVHIGRARIKKTTEDAKKHKLALIFFGLALLLILLLIPWPFREVLGRKWF